MDGFIENFNSLKPPFSYTDMDQSIAMLMNHPQFPVLGNSPGGVDNSTLMLCSSEEAFLPHKNEFQPSSSFDNYYPDFMLPFCGDPASVPPIQDKRQESNKRKHATTVTDCMSANFSARPSHEQELDNEEKALKKMKPDKSRRGRRNAKEVDKPREVVHVRARRGQATDSHSLAERVRREKINEKMRCLQDLVPGCYKAMGMAVMLDEIINYVRSLQNQVEFLSLKLSAASTFQDFSMEMGGVPHIEPNVRKLCCDMSLPSP